MADVAQPQSPRLTGLAWLPVAWLVFSIAMEAYRAWTTWPVLNEYGLPPAATWLIQGELVVAAIIIIGGLFVLATALGRMPIYPTAFTLWQGFAIAALIAIAIYTAIMPDFVLAPLSYVYWLGEILIGIAVSSLSAANRHPRLSPWRNPTRQTRSPFLLPPVLSSPFSACCLAASSASGSASGLASRFPKQPI
ncbi:MAG: hypothetical protein U1E67_21490 [Hyphomicrobiales bacterium]